MREGPPITPVGDDFGSHPDELAHVAGCADCQARAALGRCALAVNLDRVWLGVAGEVWNRRVGVVERWLGALLGSPGLARALLVAPSLILSWLAASLVVLAVGAWVSRATGEPWVALLAPAVAGAAIAHAYGPSIDPAFELSRTMVVSERLVLLGRALAIFAVNALLGIGWGLVGGGVGGDLTWRWLVPMTAVCAVALAVATLTGSANAGVAVALLVWGGALLAARVEGARAAAALATGLLPVYATIAVVGAALAVYASRPEWKGTLGWTRTSTLAD